MSIAASLAALRREGPVLPQNPPSVKLTQLTTTSSLSERAATARNALALLSAADAVLSTFEQDLYLSDTSFDRATLSPESQKALSFTVARLTLRLTPVFLTRPCTALLEWLLQTLQISNLGATEEIDGLMLCALPFHETEQFFTVARVLLRSPNAKKWRWLVKSVKRGRLVDTQFCVEKAPVQIFKDVLKQAVKCVKEGVAVAPLAGVVTNLVGRRMASDDRAVLVVLCVEALGNLRDAGDAAEHLVCALFSALAAAVSYGLELLLLQTISNTTTQYLSRSDVSAETARTSTALLALCLRRHERSLSFKDAKLLLRGNALPGILPYLGPSQSVDTYSDIIRCAISAGTPSDRLLRLVGRALEVEQLLTAESMAKLVEAILNACSVAEGEDNGKFAEERTALLSSLLTTLFKGNFSDVVDDVLQHHLASRKVEKRHKKKFQMIDAAVSKSLNEIISGKMKEADGSYPIAVDILCLSHPDRTRRRKALESISTRTFHAQENEKEMRRLVGRLKGIISFERDLQLVATALEIVVRLPLDVVSSAVIREVLLRCTSESTKRDGESLEKDKLAISLLGLCERISGQSSPTAHSILLILSSGGSLERCCEDDQGRNRIQGLVEKFECSTGRPGEDAVTGSSSLVESIVQGIAQKIFDDADYFSELLASVINFHEKWMDELSSLWLKLLWTRFSITESSEERRIVSERVLSLAKLHPNVCEELIRTFKENSRSVLGTPESPRVENAVFVWTLALYLTSWECQEEFLTLLISTLGLEETITILRDGCFDNEKSEEARKRSLEWYVNFCVVHPDKDVGMEAVVTASRIAYDYDANMRVHLNEIWSRRSLLNRKKREKNSVMWDFLHMLSTLPEEPSFVDPVEVDANILQVEMQARARDMTWLGGVRLPLREASYESPARHVYENHLASMLLRQEEVTKEKLYLLRSLRGQLFTKRDDQAKLYSLLESTLQRTKSSCDLNQIECVYHLAMLIMSSGKPHNPDFNIRRFTETVVSAFRAQCESQSESPDPVLTTTLLCIMTFVVSFTVHENFPEKASIVELLLEHGSLSTSTGLCALRLISHLAGSSVTADQLLGHVKNLFVSGQPRTKAPRKRGHTDFGGENRLRERAALGAVKTIREWVSRGGANSDNGDIPFLRSSIDVLWQLVKAHNECEEIYTKTETHVLEQVSTVLGTLTILHRALCARDVAGGREAAMEADFDALISFAFADRDVEPVFSPVVKEVRTAAYDLIEVLVTSQETRAKEVLPKLLQSEAFAGQVPLIISLLERVVPALTAEEKEVREIAKFVADTAYNQTSLLPREARMKIMKALISCRGPAIGASAITKECMREVYEREHQISDPDSAARCCSSFLQNAHLACEAEIDCMTYMEAETDCRIACFHFVSPSFLTKLKSFVDDGDAMKIASVDKKLASLFVVLLTSSVGTEEETAVRLLLASVPLSAMQVCLSAALESVHLKIQVTGLRYLGERLEADALPLFPTWQSTSDDSRLSTNRQREITTRFLDIVGSKICALIKREGNLPGEVELREVAADTLKTLVERLGPSSFSVVQGMASQISPLLSKDSVFARSLANEPGKSLILRGKVFECLASFVSTLAKYSLPFIPKLLDSSCSVLEEICGVGRKDVPQPREKSYSASVFITAAAIKVLSAILTSCPMFFGGKALRRLILLTLQSKAEAPRDILRELAAPEVPVDVFVSVFGNFATIDDEHLRIAPVDGLRALVEGVSSGVDRMYKSEMKVHWRKILNVLLRSLECGRDFAVVLAEETPIEQELENGEAERNSDGTGLRTFPELDGARLKKCVQLDESCAKVFVKMVLKLSESEFNAVFKALVQWCDGGSLPDVAVRACEGHGAEVENNLSRALSFSAIVGKLLDTLKTIMIPYFVLLITRLTSIISRNIPKHSAMTQRSSGKGNNGKKRARTAMDDFHAGSLLVSQQSYLREACLTLLASFFKLEITKGMMNTRLVGELQQALLAAFEDLDGQSEFVSKAMQGLARRMMLPGISSDTKKNQDMLIFLVREVLSRTRDPNPKLRAGALDTCKDIATAVGDEFLATLPESMPILAEVVDDEETEVAKAAERYVVLLESMAGEPIMQQLR